MTKIIESLLLCEKGNDWIAIVVVGAVCIVTVALYIFTFNCKIKIKITCDCKILENQTTGEKSTSINGDLNISGNNVIPISNQNYSLKGIINLNGEEKQGAEENQKIIKINGNVIINDNKTIETNDQSFSLNGKIDIKNKSKEGIKQNDSNKEELLKSQRKQIMNAETDESESKTEETNDVTNNDNLVQDSTKYEFNKNQIRKDDNE